MHLYSAPRAIAIALVLSLWAVPLSAEGITTEGTDFWCGFLENRANITNPPPDLGFVINSRFDTEGVISIDEFGISVPFSIAANQSKQIKLPRAQLYAIGSEKIERKGIHITSSRPIGVRALHFRLYFSDASIVLPTTMLGATYTAVAAVDSQGISASSILIVATRPGTTLEITPSATTDGGHRAGIPFTVTLDSGEVYQIRSFVRDMTGTRVRSLGGEPFALFGGAMSAWYDCESDSHVFDQIAPEGDWGHEYLLLPFSTRRYDIIKVVADRDSVHLRIGCQLATTLARGRAYQFRISGPTKLTADGPVQVAQFSVGAYCGTTVAEPDGDPTMLVHFPSGYRTRSVAFESVSASYPGVPNSFTSHFATIIIPTAGIAGVRLEGASIASQFRSFNGVAGWSYARVTLQRGSHRLDSDVPMIAYAYGFGYADGYNYWLGADTIVNDGAASTFTAMPESYRFDLSGCALLDASGGICAGVNVRFRTDAVAGASPPVWSFGDGTAAEGESVLHHFSDPGRYTVRLSRAIDSCTWSTTVREVLVSRCGVSDTSAGLSVQPNPTRGGTTLVVALDAPATVSVELTSQSGSVVRRIDAGMLMSGRNEITLDLSDIGAGTYLARVLTGGAVQTIKLVKVQ